jgi:hypothetical protein
MPGIFSTIILLGDACIKIPAEQHAAGRSFGFMALSAVYHVSDAPVERAFGEESFIASAAERLRPQLRPLHPLSTSCSRTSCVSRSSNWSPKLAAPTPSCTLRHGNPPRRPPAIARKARLVNRAPTRVARTPSCSASAVRRRAAIEIAGALGRSRARTPLPGPRSRAPSSMDQWGFRFQSAALRAPGANDTRNGMAASFATGARHWRGAALVCGVALSALSCSTKQSNGDASTAAGASPTSSAGTTGDTSTAMWTMDGGDYALSFGSTYLEIDPNDGARVIALRVGGSAGGDLIANAAVTGQADNWGSTFWPSPQTWPWPPTDPSSIAAINSQPYAVTRDADALTLTSALNPAAPTVSVIKKFSADVAKEAIVIDYTMSNGGTAPVTVAPWEITRVAAGGLTFYPGQSEPMQGSTFPLPATTDAAGVTWYQHDPSDATEYKLLADGKDGWLAHAAGDLLLIKSFPDVVPGAAAANEAEIEIFAAQKYVEVEQQGAVQTLAPGQALHWTVRWYARKLATPAALGSADLVAYVQNQIK